MLQIDLLLNRSATVGIDHHIESSLRGRSSNAQTCIDCWGLQGAVVRRSLRDLDLSLSLNLSTIKLLDRGLGTSTSTCKLFDLSLGTSEAAACQGSLVSGLLNLGFVMLLGLLDGLIPDLVEVLLIPQLHLLHLTSQTFELGIGGVWRWRLLLLLLLSMGGVRKMWRLDKGSTSSTWMATGAEGGLLAAAAGMAKRDAGGVVLLLLEVWICRNDLPALVARLRLLCGEVLTDVIHEFRLGNTAIIQIDVFQISHVEAVVDGADDANNVGLAILDGDPLANAGLCMWFIADCAILDDSTVD